MDSFFDEYPFSHNNYYSTPSPPPRSIPTTPDWFEECCRPTPRPFPQPLYFDRDYPPAPASRRPNTATPTRSNPKGFVSVPVAFIGSDRVKPSRSDYALKIQKVFRGFRVRRNVNKILELNSAVNDVAKGFMDGDRVELMRCDERERLKVNEILMALLFKLDSIAGLDDSVRLCRKAVIKKAILLQEKIDSLAAPAPVVDYEQTLEIGGKGDETLELEEKGDKTLEIVGKGDETLELEEKGGKTLPKSEIGVKPWTMQVENNVVEDRDELTDEVVTEEVHEKLSDCCDNADETLENQLKIGEETLGAMAGVDQMPVDSTDGDADTWECVGEEDDNVEFVEKDGEAAKPELKDEWFVIEESKESKKLLEKMAEDNKRLIEMVSYLCQKNATQTGLISSLSERVEKLEQAMNDRLRRNKEKKKKISALKH